MIVRLLALVGMAVGWIGLALQLYVLMTGPLGLIAGAWRFMAFFTVLMNLLSVSLFTVAFIKPTFSSARASLQTASTVYMSMVGVTYVLLLERLWSPQGLQLIADRLLHYAAPTVAVLFWVAFVPKVELRWSDALRWTGVPLFYLAYALARANIDGFYPYFFIDVPQLGWQNVIINTAGMLAAFLVLAVAYVALAKVLSRGLASAA